MARLKITPYDETTWARVLRGEPCVYCGGPGGTVEHVDPRGSRSVVTNGVGACRECNGERGSAPLLAYLLWRASDRIESFSVWNFRHFGHAIRHWQLTAKDRKRGGLVVERRVPELRVPIAERIGSHLLRPMDDDEVLDAARL